MAQSFSFDVTSTIDLQEVDNAINQARKELGQRYDFKGSPATIELDQKASTLTLTAEDAFKLGAVWEIVQTRLVRRSVPVKNLKPGETEHASAGTVRQVITLQHGIPTDAAREIVKFLKDGSSRRCRRRSRATSCASARPRRTICRRRWRCCASRTSAWRCSSATTDRECPRGAWRIIPEKSLSRAFPGYSGGRSYPPDRTLANRRPRT